jgi:hypothetical protein
MNDLDFVSVNHFHINKFELDIAATTTGIYDRFMVDKIDKLFEIT